MQDDPRMPLRRHSHFMSTCLDGCGITIFSLAAAKLFGLHGAHGAFKLCCAQALTLSTCPKAVQGFFVDSGREGSCLGSGEGVQAMQASRISEAARGRKLSLSLFRSSQKCRVGLRGCTSRTNKWPSCLASAHSHHAQLHPALPAERMPGM